MKSDELNNLYPGKSFGELKLFEVPGLEELIAECRKPMAVKPELSVKGPSKEWDYEIPFDTLMFLNDEWHAGKTYVDGFDFGGVFGSGSIHSQAVKNLYCALNPKK